MKKHVITVLLFLVPVVLVGRTTKTPTENTAIPTPSMAHAIQQVKRIKMHQLSEALTKLKSGETEYDFIGITSNGTDCLYFVLDGEKFNLEFEAISLDQRLYIERLRKWAESNDFTSQMTTYNNQPKYPSEQPAPVIRVETNSSLDETEHLGSRIENEIFGNSEDTIYDIVP